MGRPHPEWRRLEEIANVIRDVAWDVDHISYVKGLVPPLKCNHGHKIETIAKHARGKADPREHLRQLIAEAGAWLARLEDKP